MADPLQLLSFWPEQEVYMNNRARKLDASWNSVLRALHQGWLPRLSNTCALLKPCITARVESPLITAPPHSLALEDWRCWCGTMYADAHGSGQFARQPHKDITTLHCKDIINLTWKDFICLHSKNIITLHCKNSIKLNSIVSPLSTSITNQRCRQNKSTLVD